MDTFIVIIFSALMLLPAYFVITEKIKKKRTLRIITDFCTESRMEYISSDHKTGFFVAYSVSSEVVFGKLNESKVEVTKTIDNFIVNKHYSSISTNNVIIFDNNNQKLLITELRDILNKTTVVNYNDILSFEVVKDNVSVSSKSLSGTIGGAVLGGVLAGGVGAIIGGSSGDATTVDSIISLQLKLLIKNVDNPSITIKWYEKEKEMKNLADIDTCTEAIDLLTVIIDQTDSLESASSGQPQQLEQNSSVADELRKLADLRSQGIINEAEFESQKNKLLNS